MSIAGHSHETVGQEQDPPRVYFKGSEPRCFKIHDMLSCGTGMQDFGEASGGTLCLSSFSAQPGAPARHALSTCLQAGASGWALNERYPEIKL